MLTVQCSSSNSRCVSQQSLPSTTFVAIAVITTTTMVSTFLAIITREATRHLILVTTTVALFLTTIALFLTAITVGFLTSVLLSSAAILLSAKAFIASFVAATEVIVAVSRTILAVAGAVILTLLVLSMVGGAREASAVVGAGVRWLLLLLALIVVAMVGAVLSVRAALVVIVVVIMSSAMVLFFGLIVFSSSANTLLLYFTLPATVGTLVTTLTTLLVATALSRTNLGALLVAITRVALLIEAIILGLVTTAGILSSLVLGLCSMLLTVRSRRRALSGLHVALGVRSILVVARLLVGLSLSLGLEGAAQEATANTTDKTTEEAAKSTTTNRLTNKVSSLLLKSAGRAAAGTTIVARAAVLLVTTDKVADALHNRCVSSSSRSIVVVLLLEKWFAAAMSRILDALFMIIAMLDTVSTELATKVIPLTLRLLLPPLLNNAEHDMTSVSGTVVANLTQGRMVEDTVDYTIESSGDIDVLVVPALDNLGNNPFQNSASNLSSRLIEDVREVILGEHRVGGIGRVVVVEDNQLLVATALDDFGRTSGELLLDLADDRQDERSEQREDKDVELLCELFKKVRQDGDLLDGLVDAHHKLVVELKDGVDLVLNVLELLGPLFGLFRRELHVAHLSGGSVALQLINLAGLILAAEEARRKSLEEFLEQTGVLVLRTIDDALQLLNFGLSGLVIQFAHDGMEEVDTTKGTSHNRIDLVASALNTDLGVATDMREDIALAQLDKSEFGVVGMGRVVLETMACGAEKAQGLVELLLVSASVEGSTEIDAAAEQVAHQLGRRGNAKVFRGNVILQAGSLVDAQFSLFVNWGT